MTNYNDGNWWGWNGGECPVHPETVVLVASDVGVVGSAASGLDWSLNRPTPIVAFRVIKEHKEPREFWLLGDYRFYSMEDAEEELRRWGIDEEIIHVREVLE